MSDVIAGWDSQPGEQLIFNLDGAEVAVEKELESVAARRRASAVQRRVDDLLRTRQVRLPTELEPLRHLLTTWPAVPASQRIHLYTQRQQLISSKYVVTRHSMEICTRYLFRQPTVSQYVHFRQKFGLFN